MKHYTKTLVKDNDTFNDSIISCSTLRLQKLVQNQILQFFILLADSTKIEAFHK